MSDESKVKQAQDFFGTISGYVGDAPLTLRNREVVKAFIRYSIQRMNSEARSTKDNG